MSVQLSVLAVTIAIPMLLSHRPRIRVAIAAVLSSFLGSTVGFLTLPFTDVIGHTYFFVGVLALTLATAAMASAFTLGLRRVSITNASARRGLWMVLSVCVAYCPVALGLTPAIVASRIARNERRAGARVQALQAAVRKSMAENADAGRYCQGDVLKRHYDGPAFRADDWGSITTRYVTREGYAFMVFCPEKGGYRVSALPAPFSQNGDRIFCADEGGRAGCPSGEPFQAAR
jgi:hypothetical protein